MKFFLSFTLLLLISLSCNKNGSGPASPGAIKGFVTSPEEAIRIIVSLSDGTIFKTIEQPASDSFMLTSVPAGNYTVTVIPRLGYAVSASADVTIHNGETADAGTFTLTPNGQSAGFFKFNFPNNSLAFVPPTVQCTYVNNILSVSAVQPPVYIYRNLQLRAYNVTTATSYSYHFSDADSYIHVQVSYNSSFAPVFSTQTQDIGDGYQGNFTITLSTLDTTNHIVAGTVSGVLLEAPGGNMPYKIDSSSFKLNY